MNEQLVGSEIHGFHTLRDLDVASMMEEAKIRWLRPNEIHAILCNYKYFSINAKPVQLPKSGTLVLFDRKMLRNFRKDGHNWKKKKDGKTVKEAHEHLKVGNDERIHVYYAHGEDNATFVRRCYWLLDKTLEHIVLVHYRETKEVQDSPVTPMNSCSISDQLPSFILSEEFDSGMGHTCYAGGKELQGPSDNLTVQNYEMRLHELNTLEWDELVVTNDSQEVSKGDKSSCFNQQSQVAANRVMNTGSSLLAHDLPAQVSSVGNLTDPVARNYNACFSMPNVVPCQPVVNSTLHSNDSNSLASGDNTSIFASEKLQNQDSFGKWMNYIMADSPGSVDDSVLESSISSNHEPQTVSENIFNLTDVSPAWAFSTEKTKILVTGLFREDYLHLAESKLFCVCGDACVPVECVHIGVYRCLLAPHSPGLVHFYMSLDGHKPISQVLTFEYRTPQLLEPIAPSNDMSQWDEFKVQTRLAYLLFSTSKSLNILSSKVSPTALKEATKFSQKTAHISDTWSYLIESIESDKISIPKAKDNLFELALRNRLKEWLLERVLAGSKTTEFDGQGQGAIHLCAILGYTWAVYLFSWAGLSLDFRDKHGWTALHWAAYCGREKMVAVLLSAGAKPNLVTDPTSENPDGCIAADLASRRGYEGLAAFLSEQALVKHFEDMSIAGNISGSLQTDSSEVVSPLNATEDEMYLKETLAAYRSAAEAAARIQAALREHSLKVRTNAVRFSNPEEEAQNIIAAMKIQHAFRNYETKKKMVAAARIQHRFRTWKIRKEFLNMRRHAIRIQAIFRGFQVRRQYRKIMWSVGVLEKAVLRWRLKRKGFRGLQVACVDIEPVKDERQESDGEEDFYKASRKQAEERVERAVLRVQAMFRSKKAQEEYRRMKLATNEAKLEFEGLCDPAYFMKG